MFDKARIVKTIMIWLSAVSVNLASVATFTLLPLKSNACNGFCGTCGFSCITLFVAVACGSLLVSATTNIKQLKIIISEFIKSI